jgi:hypothetical protein
MPAAKKKSQSEVEASLNPELRPLFRQLVADYNEAARLHTNWKGGPSYGILGELIQRGWRPGSHTC